MKKIAWTALVLMLATGGCDRTAGIAPGVTADRIRAIRPGMTEADVINELGPALLTKSESPSRWLLFYAREVPWTNHSPTLWVYLEDGRVRQVEAKRTVMFIDDEGIYVRRRGFVWESPAFARTFR